MEEINNQIDQERLDKAVKEHFDSLRPQSNKLIEIFLIIYLTFGVVIGFKYDTILLGLIMGCLNIAIYYLTKFAFPHTNANQYAASTVFAIFMAQFIYQMHGMFEMHFFAFIGATILIKYQNWKTIIPLALVVAVHHLLFAFLQFYGHEEIYFSQTDWDLFTFLVHVSLAVGLFIICGIWSYEFSKMTAANCKNLLQINEANKESILKSQLLADTVKELDKKNKSVTDSINYAKRIQNAITPKLERIRKDLPQTSMFYKAKDIVSGDFPFYFKKDDHIYIAAVDCTGHGVPGAMISLIGYLNLRSILNKNELISTGEILSELDKGIVHTLKQHEADSLSRDGMDIALCCINLKTNEITYSGAHRPLYHVRNGELEIFDGSRNSIGGRLLKKEKEFTTHTIQIQKEDSIFFFTDGFPDQFGGPESRKYGVKRMKKDILDYSDKSADDIVNSLSDNYDSWKGKGKQIDDVLLMGITF